MNLRTTLAAACIAALTLTGCATTADLREVAATIEAANAGYITHAEAAAKIDAKADEIESRTIQIPTTPGEAIMALLGAGGSIMGTMYGAKRLTNRERDARRKELGPAYKVDASGVHA